MNLDTELGSNILSSWDCLGGSLSVTMCSWQLVRSVFLVERIPRSGFSCPSGYICRGMRLNFRRKLLRDVATRAVRPRLCTSRISWQGEGRKTALEFIVIPKPSKERASVESSISLPWTCVQQYPFFCDGCAHARPGPDPVDVLDMKAQRMILGRTRCRDHTLSLGPDASSGTAAVSKLWLHSSS